MIIYYIEYLEKEGEIQMFSLKNYIDKRIEEYFIRCFKERVYDIFQVIMINIIFEETEHKIVIKYNYKDKSKELVNPKYLHEVYKSEVLILLQNEEFYKNLKIKFEGNERR